MSRPGFHANLVLVKKNDLWNSFAFFGTSRHGKTPLSFALATRLLFRNRSANITIFDDRFEIEGDFASCDATWAAPDCVGARSSFEFAVLDCNRSIAEFKPNPNEKFKINGAVIWLLLDQRSVTKPYEIERCSYDLFAEELKKTNCRWENPPGSFDADLSVIRLRLKANWNYFLVHKAKTDTSTLEAHHVIDELAREALQRFEEL